METLKVRRPLPGEEEGVLRNDKEVTIVSNVIVNFINTWVLITSILAIYSFYSFFFK